MINEKNCMYREVFITKQTFLFQRLQLTIQCFKAVRFNYERTVSVIAVSLLFFHSTVFLLSLNLCNNNNMPNNNSSSMLIYLLIIYLASWVTDKCLIVTLKTYA